MKRVAIICELKERELLFLTVLKEKLELSGFRVRFISSRLMVGFQILAFKPDIIIINGLRSNHPFIKQILVPKLKFKCHIISLYSEQVGTLKGLAHTYNNNQILNSVDSHVVWGVEFAKGLAKLGVPKDKIFINGSFALDIPYYLKDIQLLRKQFAEEHVLNPGKKWFLVSDNIIDFGDQKPVYQELRNEFSLAVKTIADHFVNCEVIFRPHPANKKKELKEIKNYFNSTRNVSVIGSGHNIVWSTLVDAMIIWRSTSSIEAWSLEKEVFALQTKTGDFDYWHKDFTENYTDIDKLIVDLDSALKGNQITSPNKLESRKRYMQQWFYKYDGESFDRFCYILNNMKNTANRPDLSKKISTAKIIKQYLVEPLVFFKKIITGDYKRFVIYKKDLTQIKSIIEPIRTPKNNYTVIQGEAGNTVVQETSKKTNKWT